VAEGIPARIGGHVFEGTEDELAHEVVEASAGLKRGDKMGEGRRFEGCFAPRAATPGGSSAATSRLSRARDGRRCK
jgi:hypothetical protein